MGNRIWLSRLFFLAFAVALAHSSIPHIHPTAERGKAAVARHHHRHDHHSSQHNSNGHGHHPHPHDSKSHEHQSSLPVFSHFANSEYIPSSILDLHQRVQFVIAHLEPSELLLKEPDQLTKQALFPLARDLPRSRYRSTQSLRAPPIRS